jgi:hypothetical protein
MYAVVEYEQEPVDVSSWGDKEPTIVPGAWVPRRAEVLYAPDEETAIQRVGKPGRRYKAIALDAENLTEASLTLHRRW